MVGDGWPKKKKGTKKNSKTHSNNDRISSRVACFFFWSFQFYLVFFYRVSLSSVLDPFWERASSLIAFDCLTEFYLVFFLPSFSFQSGCWFYLVFLPSFRSVLRTGICLWLPLDPNCYRVLPSFLLPSFSSQSGCWFYLVFLPSFRSVLRMGIYLWLLLDPSCYRVLPSFFVTEFLYLVFDPFWEMGIVVFAFDCPLIQVLPSFYRVLPSETSFTESYLVLPSFTEFWKLRTSSVLVCDRQGMKTDGNL